MNMVFCITQLLYTVKPFPLTLWPFWNNIDKYLDWVCNYSSDSPRMETCVCLIFAPEFEVGQCAEAETDRQRKTALGLVATTTI